MFQSGRAAVAFSLLALLYGCGGGSEGGTPVAAAAAINDAATLAEDGSIVIPVTANDTGVDVTTVQVANAPANGTASISGQGIAYTPGADFNGSDSFSYQVARSDGSGILSATVTVTVTAVNDAPIANNDSIGIAAGSSSTFDPRLNDSDVDDSNDSLSVTISTAPASGTAVLLADGSIRYTPDAGFTGRDSLTYQLRDPPGATSVSSTVTINVFTATTLAVQTLTVPRTGYGPVVDPELGNLLVSEMDITISNDTVSFIIALFGAGTDPEGGLFVLDITDPLANTLTRRESVFCEAGECTVLVPKKPPLTPSFPVSAGTWKLRLATTASAISEVNFDASELHLSTRNGVVPGTGERMHIAVRPFVTGSLPVADIFEVLDAFSQIAADNLIDISLDPVVTISDERFAEVSSEFTDPVTAELVTMGPADRVNLFFLESFSGAGGDGLLGIAGGLPGTHGVVSPFNGVLLNGTANLSSDRALYITTTAEVTFHEMGHLLGLFHTTERLGDEHDILDDTPMCVAIGFEADPEECADGFNPMFWRNEIGAVKAQLSPDQRQVIRTAPITNSEGP